MGDRWGALGWVGGAMVVFSTVGSQLLSFKEVDDGDDGRGLHSLTS